MVPLAVTERSDCVRVRHDAGANGARRAGHGSDDQRRAGRDLPRKLRSLCSFPSLRAPKCSRCLSPRSLHQLRRLFVDGYNRSCPRPGRPFHPYVLDRPRHASSSRRCRSTCFMTSPTPSHRLPLSKYICARTCSPIETAIYCESLSAQPNSSLCAPHPWLYR